MFIDQFIHQEFLVQRVQGLRSKATSFFRGSVGKRVASFGWGVRVFSFGLAALGAAESKRELLIGINCEEATGVPDGFQDSNEGIVGDPLRSVGGICPGQTDLPEKPGNLSSFNIGKNSYYEEI